LNQADLPLPSPSTTHSLVHDVRRLMPLAWPVLVGQLAVLAFGTVDTLLIARHSSTDLAALAVGAAAYITTFIGFMGVVMAVSPLVGRRYGAGDLAGAGAVVHQAVWLALALSALGSALLAFPEPFLAVSRASGDVEARVRGYLGALAVSLPASLLFAVYRGFNVAVSRPKAVMLLQVASLVLKVPLSALLVFGWPAIGVPALGVVGCGIATAVCMWSQLLMGVWLTRRDAFYAPFRLWPGHLPRPDWTALKVQLRLGVPMGLAILVEVTGFSFMALFIARLGTVPVAGHQVAVNIVTLMFMVPLAIANASTALVAQRIGAGDLPDARRLGWHGLQFGVLLATALGVVVLVGRHTIVRLYTADPVIIAAALPLLAWVAVFHVADAAQTVVAFVLRAWHVTTLPVVIYALSLWGVGLGGGYALAFGEGAPLGDMLPGGHGARGFWMASTTGLVLAACLLLALMHWVMQRGARQVTAGSAH